MSSSNATATATMRNRIPFGAMLVANTISFLGNKLMVIAVPWFVLVTTGSPAKTGITGFIEAVAIIFSAFFGGTVVDRLGLKRASILGDLGSGLAVAAIPLLYETLGLTFWELLLLVFVAAFFDTPGDTARTSLIPDLAELGAIPLETANSATQAIQRFTLFLGPLLAGVLIAAMGTGNVLWLDAISYFISALLIGVAVIDRRHAEQAVEKGGRYLDELGEGLRFLRSNRFLLTLVIFVAINSMIDTPAFGVVIPVFAKQVYHSAFDLGVLFSAVGAGALVGVLLYGWIGPRLPRRLVFVVGLLCVSSELWVMAFTPPLIVCAVVFAINSFVVAPLNPLFMTILMERVPGEVRGRVFGIVFALSLVASPIGLLAAGFLLQDVGLVPTILAMASFYALYILVTLLNPTLRDLDPPETAPESASAPMAEPVSVGEAA